MYTDKLTNELVAHCPKDMFVFHKYSQDYTPMTKLTKYHAAKDNFFTPIYR